MSDHVCYSLLTHTYEPCYNVLCATDGCVKKLGTKTMPSLNYTPPLLCGPCGDYRCAQYGCIKKMMVDTSLNPVQAQPNITQPYNTNHVAALEMIVKLAGENAALEKENEKLRADLASGLSASFGDTKDAADELERLREKCNNQAMVLRRLTPDKYPGVYFIHGELGEKDRNGMPEKIMVVPTYGVDFSYIYTREEKTVGPEW